MIKVISLFSKRRMKTLNHFGLYNMYIVYRRIRNNVGVIYYIYIIYTMVFSFHCICAESSIYTLYIYIYIYIIFLRFME